MRSPGKVAKVMREFKAGKLRSSSGQKVTNPKQAVAIGMSEARNMAKGGESKAMMKREVAFMKAKGAPKSMLKHEQAEARGMARGGKVRLYAGGDVIEGGDIAPSVYEGDFKTAFAKARAAAQRGGSKTFGWYNPKKDKMEYFTTEYKEAQAAKTTPAAPAKKSEGEDAGYGYAEKAASKYAQLASGKPSSPEMRETTDFVNEDEVGRRFERDVGAAIAMPTSAALSGIAGEAAVAKGLGQLAARSKAAEQVAERVEPTLGKMPKRKPPEPEGKKEPKLGKAKKADEETPEPSGKVEPTLGSMPKRKPPEPEGRKEPKLGKAKKTDKELPESAPKEEESLKDRAAEWFKERFLYNQSPAARRREAQEPEWEKLKQALKEAKKKGKGDEDVTLPSNFKRGGSVKDTKMIKYSSGGLSAGHKSADRAAVRGKTKGTMVKMAMGGMAGKMGKVASGGIRPRGEHSIQQKGHTRGTAIKMKKGGMCK